MAVLIIIAVMFSVPAKADEISDNASKLDSSTSSFEGILVIKEGHADFLIRSENGKQRRFKVNANTIITRNVKQVRYYDLRVQDKLRVYYDSKYVVIEIYATGS
jgi:hypothetical protein